MVQKSFLRNTAYWQIGLTVFAALMGFYLSENPAFRTYEEGALDLFFKSQPPASNTNDIEVTLVFVDEYALEKNYGYYDPIPRRYLARLIDTLASKSPHTIGLDIALLDKMTVLDAGGDTLLAAAIEKAGNVIGVSTYSENERGEFLLQQPHSFFRDAFQGIGFATLPISSGGGGLAMVREVRPAIRTNKGALLPSFSAMLYCRYRNIPVEDFTTAVVEQRWQSVPSIPLYDGAMIINYAGPPSVWEKQSDGQWLQKRAGRFPSFRSSALTAETTLPAAIFKDKIVIIGNGSEYARDQFVTPYYSAQYSYQMMRGAEVHANAFHSLLNNSGISKLPSSWVFLLFLLIGYVMSLATAKLEFWGELLTCIGLIATMRLFGYLIFTIYGYWVPMVSSSVTILIAFFSMAIYMALTERRTRNEIKMMFQRYAPKSYVEELIKDPSKLELGGEERDISIIFCDIEGFSNIAETLPPKKLVHLLNSYFDVMTKAVFRCGGTLDKYVGDAILAVFGAPIDHPDHAMQACRAALEMQHTLDVIREEWDAKNYPRINVRIGVNTGHVVFGNFGCEIRYNYTGIGDAMNLAARLESANRQYRTGILISEHTYERVKERVIAREIDTIIVKGKSIAVKVYELMAKKNDPLDERREEMRESYEAGILAYREREWEAARAHFQNALQTLPEDYPSQIYLDRCDALITNPPGEDWDGIFRMTEK